MRCEDFQQVCVNWVVMVQAVPKQAAHVWSQSSGKKPAQPVQYSLRHACVCVCGLLTSLGAGGKTSEHSSKQQSTDEDKSPLFSHDKSVFERVFSFSGRGGLSSVFVCWERETQVGTLRQRAGYN